MATAGPSKNKAKGGATTPGAKGHTGGRRPVDSETRARVIEIAMMEDESGKRPSRNEIARLVGLSPSTVSRICAEAVPPITFDRSKTAAAVEAHRVDLKLERARISERLAAKVNDLIDSLDKPHEVVHWDRDGFMHRATIDRPTSGDVKNYAIAIGVFTDKHLALIRHDSDDRDLPAVDKWLEAMLGTTVVAA